MLSSAQLSKPEMPSLLHRSLVTTLHHPGVFQTPAITGAPTKDTLTLSLARLPQELEHIMEKILLCVVSTPHGQDSACAVSGINIPEIHDIPSSFLWPNAYKYTHP